MLSTRELAILTWLLVVFCWGLTQAPVRRSLKRIVVTGAKAKILVPLALMAAWC